MRRALKDLLADRPRAVAAGLGLAALLAGTAWFFTAESDRGRTASLSADAWYYHAWLPTLVYDRDVDFADQYQVFGNFYCFPEVEPGRPGNPFGVGPAVFELPLFLSGALIGKLAGSEVNGFSQPEVEASLLASLLFSLGAMFFAWRLIRRRLEAPWLAIAGPLLALAGGPVIYYAIRQPGYAHPFATFFAAWLIDAWDASFTGRVRRRRTWMALGALFGLAVLARTQLAFWGVLLLPAAGDDLRIAWRAAGRGVSGLLPALRATAPAWGLGALVCVACVLPQLLVWQALYGQLWLVPQGEGFMRWDEPAWTETLFSARNGLLAWSPLYAIGLLGLLAALRRLPRLAGALLVGVGLQALANGAAWDWWAGGSFGGRRFDSCYIAFAFGVAAAARWVPRPAWPRAGRIAVRAFTGLVLLLAAWLAVANLWLAGKTASHSARIDGGQATPVLLRDALPGALDMVAARASSLATWPARALFGWKHDVPTDRYDFMVGYHFLEERYPGLNCRPKPARQKLILTSYPRRVFGVTRTPTGTLQMDGDRARMLLGFNRHGPVSFVLGGLVLPAGVTSADVVLRLDGTQIGRGTITAEQTQVSGDAVDLRRGVNTLEIEAPAGTQLRWLELSGPPTALGDR